MANWNKNPPFVDIENINTNNKFETADGITYRDMNTIVENLQNLKNTVDGIDPGTNSPIIYLDDYYMPTNEQRTIGAPLHALEDISNPKCEVAIGKDKIKLQRIKNNMTDNTVLYCMYDYNLDRFATYTFGVLANTIAISAWMPLLSEFIKQSELVSFFDGVTELPAGAALNIEAYAVYIVQCLDSEGNSQKLQVVGNESAEGTFAIIISSESTDTGTVIISDLDKNVKSISSVRPLSNDNHLVYCKMLGKGLQGPEGVSVTGIEEVSNTVVGNQTITTIRVHYSNGTFDDLPIYAKNGEGPDTVKDPFITGQHMLSRGESLRILDNKMYFIQCFDNTDNLVKFSVNGASKVVKGEFALIISGNYVSSLVGKNLAIVQTGSVVLSELAKTTINVNTVSTLSSDDRIGYYEVDGTLEAFRGKDGAPGPVGPQGPAGKDGIGLTPEYEEYLFNATYKDPTVLLNMIINTDAVVNNKYLFTQTLSIIFNHQENIISDIHNPILDLLFGETKQNTSNIPTSSVSTRITNVPVKYKITKDAFEFILRLKYKKRADDTNIYIVNSSANIPAGYALYVGTEEPTKLYKGNIEDIIYNGTKNVSINTSAGQSIYIAFPGTVTARTQASLSTEVPLTLVKTVNFIVYDSQTGTTVLSEVTAYNIFKTAALKAGANNLILTLRGN